MYKVDLPLDQPKEKALEARRSAESARKARIFNTRLRVIGLDLDALNQQVEEKKHRQNIEKQRDQAFEMLVNREILDQDLKLVQQAVLEEELKKAALISLNNYNQAMAAERAENLREQRRTEESQNLAEIWHTMTSDMMTECAEAAESHVGGGRPPRVLPNRWRGMSSEQLRTFHREREQQRLDRQRQLEAEKIRNAAWDLQFLKLSSEAEEKQQRMAELRREQRIQMDQYNKQLGRDQQAHQDYLNKELYSNKPTKEYFYQFNTSSR
ncbi:RIB43A-like with coiled-coils protein 1 [Anableps anableps]